ncbi:MAG: M48 family metallopeptidase [Bacilli bacterium]|nr:M48 family metallopeptidase [Bacilli bacterium]
MKYQLDDKIFDVEIVKKNNKNTYIRLKDDQTIYVTTNFFSSKSYIKKLLDNNQPFLRRALKKMTTKNETESRFMLLGKHYELIYSENFKNVEIDINNSIIYIKDEQSLNKWLQQQIKELFLKRLDYNYNLFREKIPYPKLRIRKMKTRWGVCNRANNTVTLNTNLIKYDISKLDYVIIHELSHFIHFNHSKAFWSIVSQYCQNYKIIRKELNS